MKASELRIGNFFDWSPLASMGRGQDQVTVSNIGYHDLMNPIPITEEWLVKFWFEKTMAWTFVVKLKGNLDIVYYLGEKGWSIGFKSYSDFSNLIYVHQLQNLYFALTGEELTIKN